MTGRGSEACVHADSLSENRLSPGATTMLRVTSAWAAATSASCEPILLNFAHYPAEVSMTRRALRIRTVVGAVAGMFLIAVSARPAAAQGGAVEVSAGYQFLHIEGNYSMSSGWGASIAGAQNDRIKIVFDGSGHYDAGFNFHTFQAGVEVAGSNKKATPFFRLLGGLGMFGYPSGSSSRAFILTPEAGVKIMGRGHVGAQVSVGFPLMIGGEEATGSVRLSAGLVIRSK